MKSVVVVLLLSMPCLAQVRTDGSVGPKQNLAGPNFAIPHTLGKQAGGNLFHSFEKFDLKQGGVATFGGPGSVKNVLARVTDGKPTSINGTIRSTIAGADLYLMNSRGVVFGQGAELDVSGSFTATSADYIRLGSSARFNALAKATDALVSAPPEAFGFLNSPRGNVAIVQARLAVQSGKSISLISGADVIAQNAIVEAPGGAARIFATRGEGEVSAGDGFPAGRVTELGDIALRDALVNVSADSAGYIAIRGRSMFMIDSLIASRTAGGDGRDVQIALAANLEMAGSASVAVSTFGAGRGGALNVTAGGIHIEGAGNKIGGFTTTSEETASGDGGALTVNAMSLTIRQNGFIAAQTGSSGNAGRITINAGAISLDGPEVGILGSNRIMGTGNASNITVMADRFTLKSGAQIAALGQGLGEGGRIAIDAGELTIEGSPNAPTAIQAFALLGRGGSIGIHAGEMNMRGGKITVETFSPQFAGSISIQAGIVRMSNGAELTADTRGAGTGGNITINSDRLDLSDLSTVIRTGTLGSPGGGPGGNLKIDTGTLEIRNAAALFGGTNGSGAGGRIDIRADDVLVTGDGSLIFAGSIQSAGGGPGGTLTLTAQTLRLIDHGLIAVGTLGDGAGGRAGVRVGRLIIRGAADDSADDSGTGIAVGSLGGSGSGGNLTLRAGEIDAVRGVITAATSAAGNAGSVTIRTRSMRLRNSTVASGADSTDEQDELATGNAGAVSITASEFIWLRDRAAVRATAEVNDAGSITLNARSLYLNRSEIRADAAGRGGSINLTVARVLSLYDSQINAEGGAQLGDITIDPIITVLNQSSIVTTTAPGAGGNISLVTQFKLETLDSSITATPGAVFTENVANPDIDISGALVPINAFLADRSMSLVEDCTRRIEVDQSSFLLIGRGATPAEPGGLTPGHK